MHQKAEFARTFEALSEPVIHGLQTCARFVDRQLTVAEAHIINDEPGEDRNRLGLLLRESLPMPSWDPIIDRLMRLGLILNIDDGGVINEPSYAVTVAPPTLFWSVDTRPLF